MPRYTCISYSYLLVFIAATLKKIHFVHHDKQFIIIFVMCDKQKEKWNDYLNPLLRNWL